MNKNRSCWRIFPALTLGIGTVLIGAIAGCSPSEKSENTVELTLVSYMVTHAAYQHIIPQFAEQWQRDRGQTVVVRESYGASGNQTRTVLHGLEADVVALALALDIRQIEKAGLIDPGWEQEAPNGAIVTRSVPALAVREGNPQQIKTWADLAKTGVTVLTPNPKTSGVARWNFLALWGSVTETGGSPEEALQFTRNVFANAPALPKDAREATDIFFRDHRADVLINYENELILAQLNDRPIAYFVPEVNLAIEHAVAVVDRNVEAHGNREVAEAFVRYLFTPEAQREFAKVGFRPVDPTVAAEFADRYPPVKNLYTIEDLGGWDALQAQFFDEGGIFDRIEAAIGP
jgi:sulfate/thiosulfate-binding protein